MSSKISFSIIGGAGFRAQYFLRIAAALPDKFQVAGIVVRDQVKGRTMEEQWGISTYRTMDQLLEKEQPDFVVVCVSGSEMGGCLIQLAQRGIAALAETPPAADLEGMYELFEAVDSIGAKIQIAEQYHLHPIQAARLAVIQSGRLGKVTETTVSISHQYHAVSLMRKMLDVQFEPAIIKGMRFDSPILAGPDRSGPPKIEKSIKAARDLAWVNFDGKLGVYDFTKDQHRSWIRSNHLSVRGDRGEIFDHQLTVLADYQTPLHLDFKRINKGEEENQEGHYLEGIMAGERWVYRNPFIPARLYDDEIAIATCLEKMNDYLNGGPSFYSLAEALQDHYLGLMIEQAIKTGETIKTVRQPWAE